jgi:hypothetical protein
MARPSEITNVDLEGQNGTDREFNYESELRKVKSAGAITISPELFEKVLNLSITRLTCSCILRPKLLWPVTFVPDLQIPHHWVSWGTTTN